MSRWDEVRDPYDLGKVLKVDPVADLRQRVTELETSHKQRISELEEKLRQEEDSHRETVQIMQRRMERFDVALARLAKAEKLAGAVREYVNNSFEYGSSAMVEALSDFEGEKAE